MTASCTTVAGDAQPPATTTAWAAWHPVHGFVHSTEEAVIGQIDAVCSEVRYRNTYDRTNNRTGWRVVKVEIRRI